MKFSDLTNNQRAMINALAASNKLQTDALGRCCNPKLDPPSAANVLCGLREYGLVYSHAKTPTQDYCDWKISQVGMAVFTGRPDGDVVVVSGHAEHPAAKVFIIETAASAVPAHFQGTESLALAKAQELATKNPGNDYFVYARIAVASMPVPQAAVTRL